MSTLNHRMAKLEDSKCMEGFLPILSELGGLAFSCVFGVVRLFGLRGVWSQKLGPKAYMLNPQTPKPKLHGGSCLQVPKPWIAGSALSNKPKVVSVDRTQDSRCSLATSFGFRVEGLIL